MMYQLVYDAVGLNSYTKIPFAMKVENFSLVEQYFHGVYKIKFQNQIIDANPGN
jgi:hypothetical protein